MKILRKSEIGVRVVKGGDKRKTPKVINFAAHKRFVRAMRKMINI